MLVHLLAPGRYEGFMKYAIVGALLLGLAILWMTVAGGAEHGWFGPQHMGMRGMMMRPAAWAPADAPAAISTFGCTSCHAVQVGGVGPAFAWVAWRYRGQAGALDTVSSFIAHGGQGPWGGSMPNLGVPPAEAHDLASWILQLPAQKPPHPQTTRH